MHLMCIDNPIRKGEIHIFWNEVQGEKAIRKYKGLSCPPRLHSLVVCKLQMAFLGSYPHGLFWVIMGRGQHDDMSGWWAVNVVLT